jgi:hypothetical protein
MAFAIYNPLEVEEWDHYLTGTDPSLFFCTSVWARILVGAYHYEPAYFALIDGNTFETLLPVMQIDSVLTGKRGVSLPFTDCCTPIARTDNQLRELVRTTLDHAIQQGWQSVEFRSARPLPVDNVPTKRFLRHTLSLERSFEDLKRVIRPSGLRNAKRAVDAGIHVSCACTVPAMRDFYKLMCMTRKRHGLPPQPWYFFEAVCRKALQTNYGNLFMGYHAGKPVAGAVFLHFRKSVLYKFGASDDRFHHLRANNHVMWTAIQHYFQSGRAMIDFGRTEFGHRGLRQYKRGWGAQEMPLYYYRYDVRRRAFLKEKKAEAPPGYALFRKLPIPVLRAIGSWLYRHVG